MANAALLGEVLDNITAENLNMRIWGERKESCGTAMCFAGHTAVIAGHELVWEEKYEWNPVTGEEDLIGYSATETVDGASIPAVARDELGLTPRQSDAIFYAIRLGNDVDKLRELVSEVVAAGDEFHADEKFYKKWGFAYDYNPFI